MKSVSADVPPAPVEPLVVVGGGVVDMAPRWTCSLQANEFSGGLAAVLSAGAWLKCAADASVRMHEPAPVSGVWCLRVPGPLPSLTTFNPIG